MHEWRIVENANSEELAVISEGVFRHGRAIAVGGNAQAIACFVSAEGSIIAGASGRTEFNRLFVNYLWVTDSLRGLGLGSRILDRLEQEAIARRCADALIETLDERNALFYQRLGYYTVSVVSYVGPFNRHTLIKPLIQLLPDSDA